MLTAPAANDATPTVSLSDRRETARSRAASDVVLALRPERERLALQVDMASQRCLAFPTRVQDRLGGPNAVRARSRGALAREKDAARRGEIG